MMTVTKKNYESRHTKKVAWIEGDWQTIRLRPFPSTFVGTVSKGGPKITMQVHYYFRAMENHFTDKVVWYLRNSGHTVTVQYTAMTGTLWIVEVDGIPSSGLSFKQLYADGSSASWYRNEPNALRVTLSTYGEKRWAKIGMDVYKWDKAVEKMAHMLAEEAELERLHREAARERRDKTAVNKARWEEIAKRLGGVRRYSVYVGEDGCTLDRITTSPEEAEILLSFIKDRLPKVWKRVFAEYGQ